MRALTLKVGVGLSPERVLVSTGSRALQKRCTALKTEVATWLSDSRRAAWLLFNRPIILWKSPFL